MRHLLLKIIPIFIVIISVMSIECTTNLAGATTETTNGLTGCIRNGDNTPASYSIVKLVPVDYNPVYNRSTYQSDTTDSNGIYHFSEIDTGKYSVIARNEKEMTSCLVRNISLELDTLIKVPDGTLKKSGSLTATFSSKNAVTKGYVYIPGTDIYSMTGSESTVFLSDIPCGEYKEVIAVFSTGSANIARNPVTISAGETYTVMFPLWKYSTVFTLNTTASGADITGKVHDFPVLIRLNESTFDFTEAQPDGRDVIFSNSRNAILPHAVERWDYVRKVAEIWVNVDTVYGNDQTQSISMYWGNQSVQLQQSMTVFDTTNGFQGVWHLGDSSNSKLADATINAYNGLSPDSASVKIDEGVIGQCRYFDGNDYITMPSTAQSRLSFDEGGTYTVSAWVRLDTSDNASHCIVSKGYEQYYLRSTYISMNVPSTTPLWEFVEFSETNKWQSLNSSASVKAWSLITGVRQGAVQKLYCNGILVDSIVDVWKNTVSRNTANDLFIGRFAMPVTVPLIEGHCHFKGSIDEVRIMSNAQTSDWIKLCYMNQRPDDKLVIRQSGNAIQ
jgi:Concanavalin A-like lectin/glucanases superfamily/Domain of unknown function (DUF2341)